MVVLGLLLSTLIGVSLGFFGGGGSILTVPLLVYVFGLEPKSAIASSLLIVGIASVSGAVQHARAGNVRLKTGLVFGGAGMAGAYLGGRAGALVPGTALLVLFATMMVATSIVMWRGRRTPRRVSAHEAPAKLILQGLAVGLFTGLVGAGGGFLIVPALTLWAGLPMPVAVGTSLFVIVLKSAAGFSGYLSHVAVDYRLVASVAGCAIAGSFAGSRLTLFIAPAQLRRAFSAFVLAMACLILVREAGGLLHGAGAVVPTSWPQVAFAVAMLALGVAIGRFSQGGGIPSPGTHLVEQGEGI